MDTTGESNLIRFLIELEQPFDPERAMGVDPSELVRFALRGSDYWAQRALDWLDSGLDLSPVRTELRAVFADAGRPQAIRHQAQRLLHKFSDQFALVARMESGEVWDDPSEDVIYDLMLDIEKGREVYMILDRIADGSGQTYAQVIRGETGRWIVERRDGSPEHHYECSFDGMREAHRVLTNWAFDLHRDDEHDPWTHVPAEPTDHRNNPNRSPE